MASEKLYRNTLIVAIFRTGRGLQGKQTFLVKAEKQSIKVVLE